MNQPFDFEFSNICFNFQIGMSVNLTTLLSISGSSVGVCQPRVCIFGILKWIGVYSPKMQVLINA